MDAAKDLRLACKIDFDEQADEWLREVTPNVSLFCYFQYLIFFTEFCLQNLFTTMGSVLNFIWLIGYYKLMTCYRKLSLKKNQSLDFSL